MAVSNATFMTVMEKDIKIPILKHEMAEALQSFIDERDLIFSKTSDCPILGYCNYRTDHVKFEDWN